MEILKTLFLFGIYTIFWCIMHQRVFIPEPAYVDKLNRISTYVTILYIASLVLLIYKLIDGVLDTTILSSVILGIVFQSVIILIPHINIENIENSEALSTILCLIVATVSILLIALIICVFVSMCKGDFTPSEIIDIFASMFIAGIINILSIRQYERYVLQLYRVSKVETVDNEIIHEYIPTSKKITNITSTILIIPAVIFLMIKLFI